MDTQKLTYPNPQFIRQDWLDLNGEWQVYFPSATERADQFPQRQAFTETIQVPYSYTFKKSQVAQRPYQPVMWYRRTFTVTPEAAHHYLLHFEAVDYHCQVWLNGTMVQEHTGGHTPFCVDVTDQLRANNELVVRVEDFNATTQPLGKQKWKTENFLCWYTRTMGIWQNVWLEVTGPAYLTAVTMVPDIHQATLQLDAQLNVRHPATLEVTIHYHDELICQSTLTFRQGRAQAALNVSSASANFRLHYWQPDDPNLYDITFRVLVDQQVTDQVTSYFGMRGLATHAGQIYLNDQAIYQKLILNQGYYPDGGLTGTGAEQLADLTKIKAMGFNGHRIHQKIESHRMLYLCDSLGLITWAEFPSAFEFGTQMMTHMLTELPAFVAKHINHPAVSVYVLMNESWGVNEIAQNPAEQSFVNALYYQTKAYDPSRLVIGNDGWEHTLTDIATVHDYNSDAASLAASYPDRATVYQGCPSLTSGRRVFCDGYAQTTAPFILSEFGGVAYEEKPHQNSWGYGQRITSKDAVLDQIKQLTAAVTGIRFSCGFCYTQLTDVEQEVNGLLTAQHTYKFDPAAVRQILSTGQQYGFTFK
ncbi:glycoside hydrolase family 2 protein [Levilactobacillus namurensis]|uniref:glycoside hydrolase family 2 protein n=1 Tax=Levilactobacillus namurensis TaxID=380393 RepID=UPI0026EC8B2C|nr:sugar-binding domain-containing protein [Levilactobacillus namurensis]